MMRDHCLRRQRQPAGVLRGQAIPERCCRIRLYCRRYLLRFRSQDAGPLLRPLLFLAGTDAYRTVYALQLEERVWVLHAFRKKAKQGIKTPKKDIDLIGERLKWLKKELR